MVEIFEAFERASDLRHKIWEIESLKKHNREVSSKCGSCYHWMTQQCKYETKGHKVTCNDRVCDDFKITDWTTALISKNEQRISELETEIKTF